MGVKKMDISQIKYTPLDGEIIQDSSTGTYMMWRDNAWHEVKMEGGGIELGIYDMNKQIIAQLPSLTDFTKSMGDIRTLHETYQNKYYMMYGKEISYFTLFKIVDYNRFGQDVIDCCTNIGPIKVMDLTESRDAVEIWVEATDGPTCLYLFPYDCGIVQVGE